MQYIFVFILIKGKKVIIFQPNSCYDLVLEKILFFHSTTSPIISIHYSFKKIHNNLIIPIAFIFALI